MSNRSVIPHTQASIGTPVADNTVIKYAECPQLEPKYSLFNIQPKLSIGSPDDPYEKEADSVANQVMRMPENAFSVQRKCANCAEEDKIQRKPFDISPFIQKTGVDGGGVANEAVSSQIIASQGGGIAMNTGTKSFMESRFNNDFSSVKIHTDSNAIQLSQALNAQAFTVGNDVFFNSGKYNPDTDSGKHLLAHELTHTIQQGGGIGRKIQRTVDNVEINCADNQIRFNHDGITTSYQLDNCNVTDNTYDATVVLGSHSVDFQLGTVPEGAHFDFTYSIAPGQPSPNTFFVGQRRVPIICSNTPTAGGIGSVHFNARQITAQDFLTLTGNTIESIPEGMIVPLGNIINRAIPSIIGPSIVGASRYAPTPFSFIPRNTTGILWGNGHTSVWSNPEGLFSRPTIRGYRGNMLLYMGEMLPRIGRNFTVALHEGVPGSFANDAWFPMMAGEQNYVFAPRSAEQAQIFADRLAAAEYGGEYTYSPPRAAGASDPILGAVRPTEASLHGELTARGRAPMATNNCITVPTSEIEAAIGGRPTTSSGVDVMTGRGPEGTVDPHHAGRGRLMTEATSEGPLPVGTERLNINVTAGGARSMFVIRGAGGIMLVYGIYHTEERIRESIGTGHTTTVLTEEAGTWTGGILGSALGGAAAGAIFCIPSGPIDAVCVVGGFLGGLLFGAVGGTIGNAAGHELGERVATPMVDSVIETVNEFEHTLERGIYNLYGVPHF